MCVCVCFALWWLSVVTELVETSFKLFIIFLYKMFGRVWPPGGPAEGLLPCLCDSIFSPNLSGLRLSNVSQSFYLATFVGLRQTGDIKHID